METVGVTRFGMLQLSRGRLWVGRPQRWLGFVPFGVTLESRGVHGRSGAVPLRPTPWAEVSSITVKLPRQGGWPRRVVVRWTVGDEWRRTFWTGVPANWRGDLTPLERYASQRLPEAFRQHPTLRAVLNSEADIARLLHQLAEAPDVAAVDGILQAYGNGGAEPTT